MINIEEMLELSPESIWEVEPEIMREIVSELRRLKRLEYDLKDLCSGVNCLPSFEWKQSSDSWRDRCLRSEETLRQVNNKIKELELTQTKPFSAYHKTCEDVSFRTESLSYRDGWDACLRALTGKDLDYFADKEIEDLYKRGWHDL